jgi:alpha-D-ribose 1-methylphosphonate 5-triphosphate synthase subunit PhnG
MTSSQTIGDVPEASDGLVAKRRHWMSVLARAASNEIEAALEQCGTIPDYTRLRGPETGLIMVRGRAGGGGSPFNLGEMTVTRCSVRTADGVVGHAYVAGRDDRLAELAAVADAMLQDPDQSAAIMAAIVDPLSRSQAARREATIAKADATRVDFFAMRNMRA